MCMQCVELVVVVVVGVLQHAHATHRPHTYMLTHSLRADGVQVEVLVEEVEQEDIIRDQVSGA